MGYLLNAIYAIVMVAALPYLICKSIKSGKYRKGWWAKFQGAAPCRGEHGPCAWFHGVSVGEIHLLDLVVKRFRQRHPDWQCLISTTTDTGYDEARKRFPDLEVFFWPLDFSWGVKRALSRVKPGLVVLAEGEVWPNFVRAARARGVPVAVINGRLSPRSFKRYYRARFLARRWLGAVGLFAVQTEAYAACFRSLGISPECLRVTGSVKYDGVIGERGNPRTRELSRLLNIAPDEVVWIAGSTQSPEEAMVLDIYRRLRLEHASLRLVVVPRQKDRFEEVATLLARSGVPFVRRTQLQKGIQDRRAVVLFDTIGELSALWGIADIAFVGGSLDGRRGGQNMIEPAAYGATVIFGPHIWNFRDTVNRLLESKAALQVDDAPGLELALARLLADSAQRERLGQAAQELVRSQQGATQRTLDYLDELLVAAVSQHQAA
jgi:3-deoxy-D-manno-octulosonic-acid transferase